MTVSKPIYLDYQATTPVSQRVIDFMQSYYAEHYGNPHSHHHSMGWESNAAVDIARNQIAHSINADPAEIFFTSGATESNNLALIGLANGSKDRKKIMVSSIEHKCILASARYLEDQGFETVYIPVDECGFVDLNFIEDQLDDSTLMLSVIHVNNEIGTIQPIQKIGELCKKNGVIFHTDAAQSLATASIDVDESQIDMMSLSAHKVYGPKGIGALYIRKGIEQDIQPIIWGGGQEGGIRSGTLPTALCAGFGLAIDIMQSEREELVSNTSLLRQLFFEKLTEQRNEIRLVGPDLGYERHFGNLSICFDGYDAEDLISVMQPKLAVSTGSACTSGFPEPSHVLTAIGLSEEISKSVIRFGFGKYTEWSETKKAFSVILESIDKIDSRQ